LELVHKVDFGISDDRQPLVGSNCTHRQAGMRFKPTVLVADPERELRWLGRLLVPGVFDGEQYFLVDSVADGRTRFTQGEKFTGFLVTIFSGTLSATEDRFKAMNAALKQRRDRRAPGIPLSGPKRPRDSNGPAS
jgi:hypothetical protein